MAEIKLGITNNTDESRYEIRLGDELVGHAEYTLNDGLITFTHTEIDPAHEGKGLASKLVRFALDDVRADGTRKVLPLCPYVKGWMQRNTDYLDLAYNSAR